jgi:signal transduction histidine kinase
MKKWGRFKMIPELFGAGVLVFLAMLLSVEIAPGTFVDARVLIVSFVGLLYGKRVALTSGLIALLMRVIIGGVGLYAGIYRISLAIISILLYIQFVKKNSRNISFVDLIIVTVFSSLNLLPAILGFFPIAMRPDLFELLPGVILYYVWVAFSLGTLLLFSRNAYQSQITYQRIFYDSSSMMLLSDPESGKIDAANHEARKYFAQSQIRDKELRQLLIFPADFKQKTKAPDYLSYLSSNEMPTRRGVDQTGIVAIYSTLIEVQGDQKIFSILIDISEQKQAEKVKDIFLANMSHELRTPLNGILGMHSILESRLENPEDRQILKYANEAAKDMEGKVQNLLKLSPLESKPLNSKPLNIIDFCRKTVAAY